MTKEEGKIKVDGLVIEALPGTQFRVRLDNGHEVLAYLAGKMRKHYIRILLGDHVSMEMSLLLEINFYLEFIKTPRLRRGVLRSYVNLDKNSMLKIFSSLRVSCIISKTD